MKTTAGGVDLTARVQEAKARLDAHVREIIEWHFSPETGCPFWLEFASRLVWSPRKEIRCFEDLKKFPPFQDDWLRGPSGPRRLRLAVEHLCQYRGGISFGVDLDPRWVIKLIKRGRMQELEMYKAHVIEQAITVLNAGHDIRCMFATPKLLEALAEELENRGTSVKGMGITGIFAGGTEFTPQYTRFAMEELLGEGVYMTPTYGNTLMGLAGSKPVTAEEGYKITYYAPQPRAVIEVVSFDDNNRVVDYGQTGRVRLTTLTRETFIPGFLERDEGERELPYQKYPWDGISGVRPFRQFAATTAVGVY